MTDHSALIERLTEATGADRELDEAIAFATRFRPQNVESKASFAAHEAMHDYETAWNAHAPWRHQWSLPTYTASMDAARTLVSGTMWDIAGPWVWSDESVAEDETLRGREIWNAACADELCGVDVECLEDFDHHGKGATPAIALTIAALRALSQTEGTKE